jgi:monovalent cation:H+ antiporter-2, CPA2 family
MEPVPVLGELLILASISLAVVMLVRRLKLPATVGFIVAGVIIGPGGFGLIRDPELVRNFADIGVVMLLFTVGLEFTLADLGRIGRGAVFGGVLQIVLTVALVAGSLTVAGVHPARGVFFGLLLALSSTALVFKLLTDRLELTSPHGRVATGVLLLQDLMVIPFAIAVPWLGRGFGGRPTVAASPLRSIALLATVAIVFLIARRAVPWLLARAAQTRSREAFLFAVVLVTLGSAWFTSWAGLSLALGAFLGGLILAGSDLKPRIAADVLPFRDAFSSVFFIGVGMLLQPRFVLEQPVLVLDSTLGLVVIKVVAAFVALRSARVPARVSFAAAVTLAQVGEFSFVLAELGRPSGLFGDLGGQAFFAGAVFSLVLTPLLVARAPAWALALERRRGAVETKDTTAPAGPPLADHVVIAGFGLNGSNVARVLRAVRIPHVIVDLNGDALQRAVIEGSRAIVGDIANPHIQEEAGVPRARALVLALSDPTATRHACHLARSLSRHVHIIVRTRYVNEIDELHRLGANQVIPEEFETSIEIFVATLRQFHVPNNVIDAQVILLRQERYSLLRGMKLPGSVVEQLDAILTQGTCDTFLLLQHSPAIGQRIGDLGLGSAGVARAVAVVRGGHAITDFDAGFTFAVGDTLVLAGTHAEMERAFARLAPPAEAEPLL